MPMLMPLPIRKMLFNHVADAWGDKLGELDLLDRCKNLPYPCLIAHDGEEFTV